MGMPLVGLFLMVIWVDGSALPVLGSSVMVSALLQRRLPWQYTNDNPIRPRQHSPFQTDTAFSPEQASPSFNKKNYGPNAAPPMKASQVSSFPDKSPAKDLNQRTPISPSSIAISPSALSSATHKKKWVGPASSSSVSTHKSKQARSHMITPRAAYPIPPPTPHQTGPSISPFHSPPSLSTKGSPVPPALSPSVPTDGFNELSHPPVKSPLPLKTSPSRTLTLPPPPPNDDCALFTCTDPLTNTPPGSPCGCVWPIQVKLQLGVSMYSLFNMVTELTDEIAASVSLNHSQVRIMGANEGGQQLEECSVLINLVPREDKFDGTTAFSIYKKFWTKQISVKSSLFGPYRVLYVHYPGLPLSPPSSTSSTSIMDKGPDHRSDSNGKMNKPLGVKVPKRKQQGLGTGMILMVVLSSLTALAICAALAWLLLVKCGIIVHQHQQIPQALSKTPKQTEATTGPVIFRSMANSEPMSYSSVAFNYTGAAKMFTLIDIEKATNNFDALRILGEGGFGVVYSGELENGRMVAVKVLKREDQHGNREFLAEFEMLGRLHHRNLVKLIGICTEGNTRCLVYELIPNGSVESHLHGVDKESDPLDWDARMKIALGAARALAYLHEDSSPCVIHRDFKSSNILLEHDYTPKVSDFGLARAAIDEANKHISTHVMGTFGYLAPEYAMTGHLLVKSDVYSYGVVLLELLTGRKPVDLSQPVGQENLVGYARPLLTSKDGLEEIIDPAIRSTVSLDTISRVAAIASTCVQSEVSHRPFMGEVVQALKLVCNEFDETEMPKSRNCSRENLLIDLDDKNIRVSAENMDVSLSQNPLPLSTPHSLTMGMGTEGQEFDPLRRHSDSGPLRVAERKHFWQRLSLSRGSRSEHGLSLKLWPGTG